MAEKYLSYYLDLMKTVKWPNVSAKLCTLQCIFVYRTQTQTRNSIQKLPARGRKFSDVSRTEVNQVLMNFNCQRISEHQGVPKQDSPGRFFRDLNKH